MSKQGKMYFLDRLRRPTTSGSAESIEPIQYRFRDLKIATNSFSDRNKLGKGGFGVVYKGLIGGQIVAIKKLHGSSVSLLGDIAQEVCLLSSLKNDNLVDLLGFCAEAGHYLLVYEYLSNGDLHSWFTDKTKQTLSWEKRFKIIKGIASGLSYLHHNSKKAIIHMDLKPENILLDEAYNAKVADFGLSRIFDTKRTYLTTKELAGTPGYIAPELWFEQHYSNKSDVFSCGLLILEILAGSTIGQYAKANKKNLSHVVWKEWKKKRPLEIIDLSIRFKCPQDQVIRCILIGLLCVQHDPKRRPKMERVLEMLNTNDLLSEPSVPAFLQEYVIPEDSSSHIEFQPAEHARSEYSNTFIKFEFIEHTRPEDAKASTEFQSTEHTRLLEDSSTSMEFQPTENTRPEDVTSTEFPPTEHARLEDANTSTELEPGVGSERSKLVFLGTGAPAGKRFQLEDLLRSSEKVLATGGYGTTHKAVLEDGSVMAVKRLKWDVHVAGKREFEQEMEMLGRLQHQNLVPLMAYYYTGDEKLLVYDFMPNGSLFSLLHGTKGLGRKPLDWSTRVRIAAGAARGLARIHHAHQSPRLAHGNVKTTKILLDKNVESRLADYCLGPLIGVATRSDGYRPPEAPPVESRQPWATQNGDVYSFGVVLLELLTGKPASAVDLPRWVQSVVRVEWTAKVFDLELMRYEGIEEEMVALLQLAISCTAVSPDQRPKISQVVKMIDEIQVSSGGGDVEKQGCIIV